MSRGPNYAHLNQLTELFQDGGDVYRTQQPPECPLEYINVTKTGDQLQVEAKGRNSSIPEKPRVFSGNQKYQEYDKFWKFMGANLTSFEKCSNPLLKDPDYVRSKGQASTSCSGGQSTGAGTNNQRQRIGQDSDTWSPTQSTNQLPNQLPNQDQNTWNPSQPTNQLPGQNPNTWNPSQPMNQSPGQPMNQLPGQPINQLPGQPMNQLPGQLMNQLPGQNPNTWSPTQPTNQFPGQDPATWSQTQPTNQFPSQNPATWNLTQPTNQLPGQNPTAWNPAQITPQLPGQNPTTWNPAQTSPQLPGQNPTTWSPAQTTPQLPGQDPATWSPTGGPTDDYLNQLLQPITPATPAITPGYPGYQPSYDYQTETAMNNATAEISVDLGQTGILHYLGRLLILFALVMLFTTVIPRDPLELNTRLIIATAVVVIYSLLDVFRKIFVVMRGFLCSVACGAPHQ